jgi:hypothetical protein
LQALRRKPIVVTTIKARRLEWAVHLVRMSDGRTVTKVFLVKPDGRRKAGRPKLRWLDCIASDLKFMGVKRWRGEESRRKIRMGYHSERGTG